MNRYLLSTTAAAMLGVATLSAMPAHAQTSRALEQLLAMTSGIVPTRTINTEQRASKRYAIVIGNGAYEAIPRLDNARADAEITAEFLRSQGYDVHLHLDITKRGFEDVLRRVLFNVDEDTEVVVFFAGHGFQIGSENYLVPVDADLDSVYDVPFEAISLGSMVGIVGSRARLQVVILDSCRDNPFAGKEVLTRVGKELRETRTGFASQSAPLNSMLIYSTSPGAVAFDGEGENSPFTASLVEQASATPDAPVKDVFEEVRRDVYQRTNGLQVPWDSSTLVEPASFGLGSASATPIQVNASGLGISRGLARVTNGPRPISESVELVSERVAVIEADFLPSVDIGPTLQGALGLISTDEIVVTSAPSTGRLTLIGENGRSRNIEGETLSPQDVANLTLVNESVQIPATSLVDGVIADRIELTVNGAPRSISLELQPNQCDFHAGDHLDPNGMGLTRYANELEPEAALAACEAAVAADPMVGRYHYQLGRAYAALTRVDEALVSYEKARDLGHTRAWRAIGLSLLAEENRKGTDRTEMAPAEILGLFARGVKEGDPYAMFTLGREFMFYGGTPELEIEGYDLLMRSLEVGMTFAMNGLGYFYLDENSEYFDPERGLRYLRESASRGDIYGINNMGLVYSRGLGGVEIDNRLAFENFSKAAAGGHPAAPTNLAWMYLDGLVPGGENTIAAVEWFAQGLERGDANAGRYAADVIYYDGAAGYDDFDAAIFAAKAAALTNRPGSEKARDLLGDLSRKAIGGGTQKFIVELGGDVEIDGAFGPASLAAMQEVMDQNGAGPASNDPVKRLIQLAEIHWKKSKFRIDLY